MGKILLESPVGKAGKPHPDFPLFPHARGYWAKKVKGQLRYFGRIADDPSGQAALAEWIEQKDDLLVGRLPLGGGDGPTIRDLCNRFLTVKQSKMHGGELSAMSFYDYHATCRRIVDAFGPRRLVADLNARDFEQLRRQLAKGWSPVTLANEIRRIRVVFHYAEQNQLVSTPIRYGSEFKPPAKRVLRIERRGKAPRMFEAVELRAILDKATIPMKAMILLGVNCGMGNADIAALPIKAVDLASGWLDYPRGKTGIPRRCPLWPATVAAIRETLDHRPLRATQTMPDCSFSRGGAIRGHTGASVKISPEKCGKLPMIP